jgi:D-glycero-D-manno-heptose 1,7-bisphosphate phosphatase
MSQNRLIILDRDGVINEDSDDYVKSLGEWIPIPGSIEAIANLSKAGYIITIATNQSGIGRGLFDLDELEKMHNKLSSLVEGLGGHIDGIFYCPHTPQDECNCRKPRSGLITAIEEELATSAQGAYIVGDSVRDLEAGVEKHCLPVLVKTGKGAKSLVSLQTKNPLLFAQTKIFNDLKSFADYLAGNS